MDLQLIKSVISEHVIKLVNALTGGKGIKSKRGVFFALWLLWGLHAFFRERGWLLKKSLAKKHIYLTGAGSGLGRYMAISFAKQGANLTLSDINEAGLLETANMIKKAGLPTANVLTITLDVSNREQIRSSAQQAIEKFGDVDVLINNAGIVQGKTIMESNESLTSKVMLVNVESHFWLVREFLPAMMRKNQGHIVSIASVAGIAGSPDMTDYSASKFAAVGMMDSLRCELKRAGKNIKCTTICPFFINTGMFDGVTTGALYGFLDQHWVVRRIVNAIRQDEEVVTMPWSMGPVTYMAKMLLPVAVQDLALKYMLGWDMMSKFNGRKEQNAIFKTGGSKVPSKQ